MDKEQLFDTIIKKSLKVAECKFPEEIEYRNILSTGKRSTFANYFFETMLSEELAQNGLFTNDSSVSPERRNTARTSAFAVSVVSSIFMTEKMHESIDEFFDRPENNQYFEGKSEQEIQDLKKELKDYVTDTLSVKANTEAGKAFVQRITDKFNEIASNNDNPDKNVVEENSNKLLSGTSTILYVVNSFMNTNDADLSHALDLTEQFSDKTNDYEQIMIDAIRNDAAQLATEEEFYTQVVRDMDISIDNNSKAKLPEFVEHYKNNQLTDEEINWARDVFDSAMTDDAMDFSNVMLDGKPMFSKEQIDSPHPDDLKVAVVAEALSGNEVTVKDKENEKLTLLTPKITETVENTNKSFWQKIVDFFANLWENVFNKESKEKAKADAIKVDEMKENISTKLKEFNNKQPRQKITVDDLLEEKTLGKFNSAQSSQNDLSNAKKEPSTSM